MADQSQEPATLGLGLEDVLAAHVRIKAKIHKTPLLRSAQLSKLLGCDLYVKAEHLQKTGSFKARGALNFLSTEPRPAEVYTTFSSGNHGQALSWAAQRSGRRAVIFMPEDASPAKIAAVRGYGGEVRMAGLSNVDRRQACEAYAAESGAVIVPPYESERIMAGQGTAMIEIIEDLPIFDAALIQAGGGGLLSGNALVLDALGRRTQVYACEPEAAADAAASLRSGQLQQIGYPATIADGVRNLCLGDRPWSVIRRCVSGGLTCSEDQIVEAMQMCATYMKQYVEPSGAVSLACLAANREQFAGKKVVVFASGGNMAMADYARLVSEHGRRA